MDSAETLFDATAAWAGAYLDYDVSPLVDIETGVELLGNGFEFRKG